MLGEKFLAHTRLVVEATQRGFRGNLCEIAIALFVLCQHEQVVVSVAFGRCALNVVVFFLADVKFATDDWLNSGLVRGVHKMHRAKNIAVIGHGHGGHAELFHAVDELLHIASTVKH